MEDESNSGMQSIPRWALEILWLGSQCEICVVHVIMLLFFRLNACDTVPC